MPRAELLTVPELARQLQVKPSWIYERTRRRGHDRVPHFRLGKYVRFDPSSAAFQTWLDSHVVASREPEPTLTGGAEHAVVLASGRVGH